MPNGAVLFSGSLFSPLQWQNSRCVSGPNSLTHDLTRASAREAGRSLTPAYMSSLQSGYNELGPEQLDRLQQDVNSIKNNYRRANVGDDMKYLLVVQAKGFKSLLLSYTHLHLVPSILLCSWQLYWAALSDCYRVHDYSCSLPTGGPCAPAFGLQPAGPAAASGSRQLRFGCDETVSQ